MAFFDSVRGVMGRLARSILDRNVVPWTLAYLAGAWVLVEAANLLVDTYDWPPAIGRVVPIVVGIGTLSAIAVAWFHGASGWQRITRTELAVHGLIAVLLVVALAKWRSGGDPPPEGVGPITELAVFYFEDHSPDGRLGGLAADLTEQVAHRLQTVPALAVRSLAAARTIRDGTTTMQDVLSELNVGAFLGGSVTAAGDSILATAQLAEVSTGDQLGSWVVKCQQDGGRFPLGVLAEAVADSVRLSLGRAVRERRAERGTSSAEALEAYRRARVVIDEAALAWREDRLAGLSLLEEADSLAVEAERWDPGWEEPVRLRIEVAELAAQLPGGPGTREAESMQRAIDLASRALGMVRDSSELLALRGRLLFDLGRHSDVSEARQLLAQAEEDLRAALRLDPDRAETHWVLSRLLDGQGRYEAALELAERAYQLDSFLELDASIISQLIMASLQLERIEDAGRWCHEGRRLYSRDQRILQQCLFYLASLRDPGDRDIEQAWQIAGRFDDQGVGMAERRAAWTAFGAAITAAVLTQAGAGDSAEHVLRRVRPVLDNAGPQMQASGRLFEALTRYRLGQHDEALALLAEYVALSPASAPSLRKDWWFRRLWDDPRYRSLYSVPTESGEL